MRFVTRTVGWMAALAIVGCVLLPGECRAQAKCPWLNAATAAGFLGGDVQVAVAAPKEPVAGAKSDSSTYQADQVRMDRFDVSCEFTRKVDSGSYTLSIAVTTMPEPAREFAAMLQQCAGATIPIRGVGNEAFQCVRASGEPANAGGQEQVIARVRDRAFLLKIRRAAAAGASAELRNDTRNIAEQVAGSLF